MAIAVDASSPARVIGSGATLVTAAFTPPSNCILAAFMFGDANNSSLDETLTPTDSASGTWSTPVLDNARGGAAAAVAYRIIGTSPGSMTVTLTDNKGSVAKGLYVRVLTGTDLVNPLGATAKAGTASISVVSTVANSWVWSAYLGSNATVTAGAATTMQDEFGGFDSGDAVATFSSTNTTASAGTTITITESGGTAVHHVAVEFVPPSSSTPISLADTGSSSETLTVAAATPLADAGSAAQALTASDTAPLADAGSATQSLTATAAVPLADTASAVDTALAGIAISPGDTGSGADTLGITAAAPLADAGTAAQSLTVAAAAAVADAASAADTMTVVVTLALADAGHAAEAATITAAVGLADTGAGADTATGSSSGGASKTLTDGGTATEALCVCKVQLRPSTGTTTRPGTGTTTRPNTGTVGPCSC